MKRAGLFTGAIVVAVALFVGPAGAQTPSTTPGSVSDGADLFAQACASCHGSDGNGGAGPTLVGVGAAMSDFELTTGRMPMTALGVQPRRKPPAFSPQEIADLNAFVASLGDGPPIPDVTPDQSSMAQGGTLFRANCAACHGATGTGTALSYGRFAPSLYQATPTQIGEAIRTGPGNMPVFSSDQLSAHDIDAIAAYIGQLQKRQNPGGFDLGRIGPIPEGMVGWLVGIVGLVFAARWIERSVS